MAPEPSIPEPARIATSDELRRAALRRSARRNAEVARQRLRRRWTMWATIRLVQLALATVLAGGVWWVASGRDAGMAAAWLARLSPDLQALVNRVVGVTPPQAQSPSSAAHSASHPTGDP